MGYVELAGGCELGIAVDGDLDAGFASEVAEAEGTRPAEIREL